MNRESIVTNFHERAFTWQFISVGQIRNEEGLATNLFPDVPLRKIKLEKQNNQFKYQKNYQLFVSLSKLFGKNWRTILISL